MEAPVPLPELEQLLAHAEIVVVKPRRSPWRLAAKGLILLAAAFIVWWLVESTREAPLYRLMVKLDAETPVEVRRAQDELRRRGDAAVPVLEQALVFPEPPAVLSRWRRRLLGFPDRDLRAVVPFMLAQMGDAGRETLRRHFDDGDPRVRLACVQALAAPPTPRWRVDFERRLDDLSTPVRLAAAQALGALNDSRALAPLRAAFDRAWGEEARTLFAVAAKLPGLDDASRVSLAVAALSRDDADLQALALEQVEAHRLHGAVDAVALLLGAESPHPLADRAVGVLRGLDALVAAQALVRRLFAAMRPLEVTLVLHQYFPDDAAMLLSGRLDTGAAADRERALRALRDVTGDRSISTLADYLAWAQQRRPAPTPPYTPVYGPGER